MISDEVKSLIIITLLKLYLSKKRRDVNSISQRISHLPNLRGTSFQMNQVVHSISPL
jgi:hypothetical protein